MRSLNKKLPPLKRKGNKKKFYPQPEPLNLRNFKKKKLPRNLKQKKWNKNFWLLRPFKKLKLLLQRKQLLKLILQD